MNEKFGDRELAIIGAGAFLAVLCLLFKWPFFARIAAALLLLTLTTIFALARISVDKYTVEEWLSYRLNRKIKPVKYVYKNDESWGCETAPKPVPVFRKPSKPAVPVPEPHVIQEPATSVSAAILQIPLAPVDEAGTTSGVVPSITLAAPAPVTIAWEEIGVYRLVTIWLLVVGFYFVYWLYQGGTTEIGQFLKSFFPAR